MSRSNRAPIKPLDRLKRRSNIRSCGKFPSHVHKYLEQDSFSVSVNRERSETFSRGGTFYLHSLSLSLPLYLSRCEIEHRRTLKSIMHKNSDTFRLVSIFFHVVCLCVCVENLLNRSQNKKTNVHTNLRTDAAP